MQSMTFLRFSSHKEDSKHIRMRASSVQSGDFHETTLKAQVKHRSHTDCRAHALALFSHPHASECLACRCVSPGQPYGRGPPRRPVPGPCGVGGRGRGAEATFRHLPPAFSSLKQDDFTSYHGQLSAPQDTVTQDVSAMVPQAGGLCEESSRKQTHSLRGIGAEVPGSSVVR